MGGGILATHHDDLARRIERAVGALPRSSAWTILTAVGGSLVYAYMLSPSRYWLLDRLPFLGLGLSRFEPSFPITRLSVYQQRLAQRVFPLLDSSNQVRRAHADQLRAGIEGVEGIEVPRPLEGAHPVYLRFPMLTRDEKHRASLLRRFRNAGIVASASYPMSIDDIPGIAPYLAPDQEPCPGARSIAARPSDPADPIPG
jgi:hypothetical protein